MSAAWAPVLDYWFAGVADGTHIGDDAIARWFAGGGDVDLEIRERFAVRVEAALAGALGDWALDPSGCVALVVLLDQFTRNLFRGHARAFAGDERAFGLARAGVESGAHLRLSLVERYFLYLPYEHREHAGAQRESLRLFRALAADAPEGSEAPYERAVAFAERHAETIDRFGRFPARNAALGRRSTPDEAALLAERPEGF